MTPLGLPRAGRLSSYLPCHRVALAQLRILPLYRAMKSLDRRPRVFLADIDAEMPTVPDVKRPFIKGAVGGV